jgi:transposase
MPAAYSDDLRDKVLAAVDRGEKKSHVSRMFNISRNTLDLWLKRRDATGSASPVRGYHRGPDPKVNDLEAFRAFANAHGHLTQQQMADLWPEPITDVTVGKALRRIGFTRKKRHMGTAIAMRPSAEPF